MKQPPNNDGEINKDPLVQASVSFGKSMSRIILALQQDNQAYPREEMTKITNEIDELSNEMLEMDEKISKMKLILQRVETERNEFIAVLDHYRAVKSPIRSIPRDVLGEIFMRCIPDYGYPTMSSSEAPMLLTRICSTWREIAFSSPRLWCKLHFPWVELPENRTDRHDWNMGHQILKGRSEGLAEWITRSRSLPLSLSVFISDNNISTPTSSVTLSNNTKKMLAILQSCTGRWKEFEIYSSYRIFQCIASTLTGPFPHLQGLRITSPSGGSFNSATATPAIICAPNLQRLSIETVRWDVIIPFSSSLTEFTFHHSRICSQDIITILSSLPQLVHCKIFLNVYDHEESMSRTVNLPFLESLYIVDMQTLDYWVLDELITCFQVPKLQWFAHQMHPDTIHPQMISYNADRGFPAFELVKKCGLDLKKLSIYQYTGDQKYLKNTFKLSPSLVHLQIDFDLDNDMVTRFYNENIFEFQSFDLQMLLNREQDALYDMRRDKYEATLLPKLQIFEARGFKKVTDKAVLEFVLSRLFLFNPFLEVQCLRTVKITFFREMQEDISPQILKRAKELGLNLDLELEYFLASDAKLFEELSNAYGAEQSCNVRTVYYPYTE